MQEPNNRNPENTMPLDPFAAAEAPVQSAETTYPVVADGEIHELTLDELIEAAAKCRHAKEIQVILAGKGPLEKKYRRLAEKLPNPIVMEFYEPARLLEILHMADLYVHTSDAEIEAMSCMEAFACGLVPVIADSPRSATPQFALDERSLFPAGDTDALAQRIDWWIEHPEERQAMERRYAEHARQYSLEESIRQTEEMFRQAIAEQRGAKA